MLPALVAHADQIRATLREAERPLTSGELYRLTANDTWGFVATVKLLEILHLDGQITTAGPACCPTHARWCLPADV